MELKDLHKELKKQKYNKVVAYGTGVIDGYDSVILYWPTSNTRSGKVYLDELKSEIPEELGELKVVQKTTIGLDIVGLPKNKRYLGEQCAYWQRELEYGRPDKFAYPKYEEQAGKKVVYMIEDFMARWYHEDGEYKESVYSEDGKFTGYRKYDAVAPGFHFYKVTVEDGIPHDEREGWCFKVKCKACEKKGEDEMLCDICKYPVPRMHLFDDLEQAKAEARRRIDRKIEKLGETLEYIENVEL